MQSLESCGDLNEVLYVEARRLKVDSRKLSWDITSDISYWMCMVYVLGSRHKVNGSSYQDLEWTVLDLLESGFAIVGNRIFDNAPSVHRRTAHSAVRVQFGLYRFLISYRICFLLIYLFIYFIFFFLTRQKANNSSLFHCCFVRNFWLQRLVAI